MRKVKILSFLQFLVIGIVFKVSFSIVERNENYSKKTLDTFIHTDPSSPSFLSVVEYLNSSAYLLFTDLTSWIYSDILYDYYTYSAKVVSSEYTFHHDPQTNNELWTLYHDIQESYEACKNTSCLIDCRKEVLFLVSLDNKKYIPFLSSLYHTKPKYNLSSHFDWIRESTILPSFDILSHETKDRTQTIRTQSKQDIEFGGGSGFGYQIYCDDIQVISMGTGHGGGYEGHDDLTTDLPFDLISNFTQTSKNNSNYDSFRSFGEGHGGGIQINRLFWLYSLLLTQNTNSTHEMIFSDYYRRNNESDRTQVMNIGGGSGCGICNRDQSFDNRYHTRYNRNSNNSRDRCRFDGDILCGYQSDCENTIDSNCEFNLYDHHDHNHDLFDIFNQSFFQEIQNTRECNYFSRISLALDSCYHIRLSGGGGGGGGTAECCLPFTIGYGFNFHIDLSKESNSSNDTHSSDNKRIVERNNIELSNNRNSNSNTNINRQYRYDSIGYLFHLVVSESTLCKGYSDWCCICQQAKNISTQCLNYISSNILPSNHSLSCDENIHGVKINSKRCNRLAISSKSWILSMSCCNHSINSYYIPSEAHSKECFSDQNIINNTDDDNEFDSDGLNNTENRKQKDNNCYSERVEYYWSDIDFDSHSIRLDEVSNPSSNYPINPNICYGWNLSYYLFDNYDQDHLLEYITDCTMSYDFYSNDNNNNLDYFYPTLYSCKYIQSHEINGNISSNSKFFSLSEESSNISETMESIMDTNSIDDQDIENDMMEVVLTSPFYLTFILFPILSCLFMILLECKDDIFSH